MNRQPRRDVRQHPARTRPARPKPFALWPGWAALLFLLLVGGFTAGAVLLVRSGYLDVREVEIVGARHVPAAELRRSLQLEGQSMIELDAEAIRRTVAAHPLVADVAVKRHWPATVRITLREREPWGYWQVGQRLHVVDREGVVVEGLLPPADAPLIVQVEGTGALRPGDRVDASAIRLVEQLSAYNASRLEQAPATFEWAEDTGVVVVTKTELRVVFGDAQDFNEKMALWAAVLDEAAAAGIAVREIDLRFGRSPAIRGQEGADG